MKKIGLLFLMLVACDVEIGSPDDVESVDLDELNGDDQLAALVASDVGTNQVRVTCGGIEYFSPAFFCNSTQCLTSSSESPSFCGDFGNNQGPCAWYTLPCTAGQLQQRTPRAEDSYHPTTQALTLWMPNAGEPVMRRTYPIQRSSSFSPRAVQLNATVYFSPTALATESCGGLAYERLSPTFVSGDGWKARNVPTRLTLSPTSPPMGYYKRPCSTFTNQFVKRTFKNSDRYNKTSSLGQSSWDLGASSGTDYILVRRLSNELPL